MAYVRFTDDFDYRPTRNTLIAYRAGMERTVKRGCADKAIAAKKAVELPVPSRGKADGENPEPRKARSEA